jgi:MFS family permease
VTAISDASRTRRAGLVPMFAAIAATTVGQLPVFLTGSLAPQIGRDLAFSASGLGVAVAAFFASAALCSATLAKLPDRLGGRTTMRLGTIPAVCGGLVIGFGVHSSGELVAALVLAGVANGVIQPAANRYLARAVGDDRQGLAFGVKQAAIPAATLLSGLAVPVLGATIGWRWGFVGLAALAASVGLLIPWRGSARAGAGASTPSRGPAEAPFARTALIILAVGLGTGSVAVNALGAFFVSSAVHIGVSDSAAGLTAAAGSAASMSMRLIVGFRADRRTTGHLRLVATLAAAGSLGLVLLALQTSWLLVPAAIIGYGAGWGWAGLFTFAVVRTHPAAPGRASSIIQTGASAGASLGPLGFAMMVEHAGYRTAWLLGAVLLLIAAAIILVGRRALYVAGVVR